MKVAAIIFLCLIGIFALVLLFLYIKSRRPIRSAAINALTGIAALTIVNLTARFSGVHIPVNIYTVPAAAVFGIPAVCTVIVLDMII